MLKLKFYEKIIGWLFVKSILKKKDLQELEILAKNNYKDRDAKIIKYYAQKELLKRLNNIYAKYY